MSRHSASIIEGFLFIALAAFFLALLAGGGIAALVHPRMNVWICVAAAIAAAIGIALVFRRPSGPSAGSALLRALPLVSVMAAAGVYSSAGGAIPVNAMSAEEKAFRAAVDGRDKAWKEASAGALPKTLDFGDDALYWPLYNRIYDDPEKAKGKRIRVAGFAYRDDGDPPGTFLVARNLMWCCSADMTLIGFLVRYEGAQSIEKGRWVEVEGVLDAGDASAAGINGSKSPIVVDARVRPAECRNSKVIFPF
jgi:uncharacterized repeat protein (TIGR03943 family)